MSRARTLADQFNSDGDLALTPVASVNAGQIGGRRNLIINGAMQVWQRGTSLSITTSNFRIADRWVNYPGTGGGGTASQQAFTIGQTDVPGEPEYYLRHAQSTGASSAPNVQTRIEGVRTGAGQTVSFSFYARVTSGTLTIDPIIRQYFGSGGSSNVDNTPTDITVTTSWQRFTRTITLPSISGKTIGSNDQLQVRLELPTSTTFTLDIALAQLEISATATDFEHRSYGEELALCQRYYQKFASAGAGTATGASQAASAYSFAQFAVPMRDAPNITLGSVTDSQNTTSVSAANITNHGALVFGISAASGRQWWAIASSVAEKEL